jgi:hypothetical protein
MAAAASAASLANSENSVGSGLVLCSATSPPLVMYFPGAQVGIDDSSTVKG